jgi:hypothetical protein
MNTDQKIEGPQSEADPHIPIDHPEAPRDQEMTIMRIGAEETLDDLRSITKMFPKITPAALEFHMKT